MICYHYKNLTGENKSMKYVFLAIFIISSTIHLYACKKKNVELRAYTKGFILLALLGWYCCCVDKVSWIVVIALLASWLGDVLLIPNGVKWFTVGGISFMVSHAFFVLTYYPNVDFAVIPLWLIIAAAAVYFIAVLFVFKGLKDHLPKALFYPMFLYLLINGTMNCFAFYQLVSMPCAATAVTFIGAMLFFASDSLLFYTRFKKETRLKTHFPVMVTYIFAEFLIVLGIIMLSQGR